MKLIIDIPEKEIPNKMDILTIDLAFSHEGEPIQCNYPFAVLPKGHGRLIDADELEELFGKKCVGDCGACITKRKTDGKGKWYDTCSLIDNAPTIIESDKEK